MMKITYRSTVCDHETFCALGRKYRLYAEWGLMQYWYREPENVEAMAVAYSGRTPIAMAMLVKHGDGFGYSRFGVFVRAKHRRCGIGTKLVALVKKRAKCNFMVSKTYASQKAFFDSLGMRGYM